MENKYPWVIPKTGLVDNFDAVHRSVLSTARKLGRNPGWREIYEDQLKEIVGRKLAKEVSLQELSNGKQRGGKTYWTSHLTSLNPASKSSPIRTVFNSSQTYKGQSLNSSWMLGPDMTGDLCGILMRFREEQIRYFRTTRLVMSNKPSANCSQIALRETP